MEIVDSSSWEANSEVIGLRVDPDDPEPRWFTVWINGFDEDSRALRRGGRIVWKPTAELAAELVDDEVSVRVAPREGEGCYVVDVAEGLYRIDRRQDGYEVAVLEFLNSLDDLLIAAGVQLPSQAGTTLDLLVRDLTEGESLSRALAVRAPGREAVDAVLLSLGYVLAFSDFEQAG